MKILNTKKYSFGISECIIYKILIILAILLLVETILIVYAFNQPNKLELRNIIYDSQLSALEHYYENNDPIIYDKKTEI